MCMTWLNLEWATLQLALSSIYHFRFSMEFFFNNISKIYLAQMMVEALAKNNFKWYAMSLYRGWGYKCLVSIFHCTLLESHTLCTTLGKEICTFGIYLTGWATSGGFINFAKAELKPCEIAIIPFMHYICVRKKKWS